MADNSKDELVQLIKRFGDYLTAKIGNLDSQLVGALAGLAVAILFTWRLLRSPSGPQRRQPKWQTPIPSTSGVSAHSNANLTYSEDSRAQNVIDEFFQPVKVTCQLLGVVLEETSLEELQNQATVRSSVLEVLLEITKFCDLYLMERVLDDESEGNQLPLTSISCPPKRGTNNLFETPSHHSPTQQFVPQFLCLSGSSHVGEKRGGDGVAGEGVGWRGEASKVVGKGEEVAMEARLGKGGFRGGWGVEWRHLGWRGKGGDGWGGKKVLLALEDAGVFTSGGLVKDKVLFCSTENGRTSFVRQLEPDWHIDSNPEIVSQLALHNIIFRVIKGERRIEVQKPVEPQARGARYENRMRRVRRTRCIRRARRIRRAPHRSGCASPMSRRCARVSAILGARRSEVRAFNNTDHFQGDSLHRTRYIMSVIQFKDNPAS
ncbi:peroxin 22 [Actinidia rufa]|uniref:Peroxin 22 n=1 Tax=Actinidia rufa TaxID=165716 RepID=A0A7J0FGN8_9ERIC|nr:peroxin 22 [Actinidia rufa]